MVPIRQPTRRGIEAHILKRGGRNSEGFDWAEAVITTCEGRLSSRLHGCVQNWVGLKRFEEDTSKRTILLPLQDCHDTHQAQ